MDDGIGNVVCRFEVAVSHHRFGSKLWARTLFWQWETKQKVVQPREDSISDSNDIWPTITRNRISFCLFCVTLAGTNPYPTW